MLQKCPLKMCACLGVGVQPQQQHASCETPGIAPLVHSAVLTDRRHILTKDAQGNVELWNIATGTVEERFGKVGSSPAMGAVTVRMIGTECCEKA